MLDIKTTVVGNKGEGSYECVDGPMKGPMFCCSATRLYP